MSYSSPDTNILIHHLVGGRPHQQEGADDYFDAVKADDTTAVLLHNVDLEFRRVLKKRIAELRRFAQKAKEHSSWQDAEEFVDNNQYAENFADALKENTTPRDALSYLSSFKQNKTASFRRLKRHLKVDDEHTFPDETVSEVEDKLPDKEGEEEKEMDACIVCSAFTFSHRNTENLTIISDDRHLVDADYNDIEAVFDYDNYQHYVSCNRPQKFVGTL